MIAPPSGSPSAATSRDFTLHRECGWASVAIGFSFAILAEAFPVHLLVARGSPLLAWALTAFSLSGLVWVIADTVAFGRRPTRLLDDAIDLHVGSRWSARIPYASIAAFREVRSAPPPKREKDTLRAVVLGDPTYVIELREPLVAAGPGGVRREFRRVMIAPDDHRRFAAELQAALTRTGAYSAATPAPAPAPSMPALAARA